MAFKQHIEQFSRQTWLVGLGAYSHTSTKVAKSLDQVVENSQQELNSLIKRGTELEQKINTKFATKNWLFNAKTTVVKQFQLDDQVDQELDNAHKKIDQLTQNIEKVIQQRQENELAKKIAIENRTIQAESVEKKSVITTETAIPTDHEISNKNTPSAVVQATQSATNNTKTKQRIVKNSRKNIPKS